MSDAPVVSQSSHAAPDSVDRLLEQLDTKKLTRFHWKVTLVAGMGFLTDAYDLFVIGTVLLLIGKDPSIAKSSLFAGTFVANSALIGSSALIASFLGALIFGTVADRLGRRVIYGLELLVLALGAIASAIAPSLTWLIIARFILGVGIGGDYPVSATIISEHSNKSDRGKLIATVFSMQAAGIVAGYVAALVVLGAGAAPGPAWRILLALGAVPALLTFWLRRSMPESPRFLLRVRADAEGAREAMRQADGDVTHRGRGAAGRVGRTDATPYGPQAAPPRPQWSWQILFTSPRFLVLLLGTAGAWFLMDYAYYGNTISSPLVIQSVLGKATPFQTTLAGFVIVLLAAVPGYIIAILTLDKLGRKTIQLMGFAAMAVAFTAIALIPTVRTDVWLFAAVYGVSYFFTEFGPNTTTFLYPAEVFPTAARTTGHGIAAGVAKIGAFVGVVLFPLLEAQHGGKDIPLAVGVAAAAAALGFALTLLLPEPNQRSLEETDRELLIRQAIAHANEHVQPAENVETTPSL